MSPWLRLCILSVSWLLALRHAGWLLAKLLPNAWLAQLSLPSFSMLAQVSATAVGLGITLALFRDPRPILGVARPDSRALTHTFLVTPALFVAISVLALEVAMPWLLEELQQGRVHASKENAGAMGRAVQEAPLLSSLLWAALFAGLAEELFFRGVFFTFVRDSVLRFSPNAAHVAGLGATLASAALFGFLHADTPGGVGVVRIVSTTCLGLVCGLARQLTKSIVAPILLHTTYNVLALAVARKWLDVGSEPLISALPNGLVLLAGAGIGAVISLNAFRMAMQRRRRFE